MEVFAENTLTDFESANISSQVVIADGQSTTPGYTLQTRDFCKNLVTRGGLSSDVTAKFIQRSNETSSRRRRLAPLAVEDGVVTDNSDGTYTVSLATTTVGDFDLYVSFGTGNVSCDIFTTVGGSSVDVTFNNQSGCFFAQVEAAAVSLPVPPPPTASPTAALVLPPTEPDDELLLITSSIGGTLGFLAFFAAFLAFRYRRQWRKDKQYIEEGMMYKNDALTNFDPNDKLSAAGAQLLATRQAILRLRAQAGKSKMMQELHALEEESEELLEQIRVKKQQLELSGATRDVPRTPKPREAITKMEF